jgi:hypothetical protein
MIETSFDTRVKIHQIVSNHLPEFLLEESPKTAEFLKQYYISQEFQSGTVDIVENLDQYLKLDNLTPEIIDGTTTLLSDIEIDSDTIIVSSTKGYPSEYGLLQIDDEIITYTGLTTNTFTGCIRGFSGITKYSNKNTTSLDLTQDNYKNDLVFSTSSSSTHSSGSTVINLSTLFLKEFYNKLKYSLAPGLENSDLANGLSINNFIKSARSFYQSKGTEESFRILFLVLYGIEPKLIDLENYLIKPSYARFIRREIVVAELVSDGDPLNLIGQTIKTSYDSTSQASVSEVEILTRRGKTYYKIYLFIGYDENDLIEGEFRISGKTKVLDNVSVGSSVIAVDSTIGFPSSGVLISGNNNINYTSKNINQFFGCSGITEEISTTSDIRSSDIIYGYENGDTTKKVELRITGSLSKIENAESIVLSEKGDIIKVKNLGQKILNPSGDRSFKEIIANSFLYNTSTRHNVISITGSTFKLGHTIDKSSLKVGDKVDILVRGSTNTIVVSGASIYDVNLQNNEVILNNLQGFIPEVSKKYDIRRKINYAKSLNTSLEYGNDNTFSDVGNLYSDNDNVYVASNSLPSYTIDKKLVYSSIPTSYNTLVSEYFQSVVTNPSSSNYQKYSVISFDENVPFITGDEVVYLPENTELPGLSSGSTYYVEVIDDKKIRLYESRSFITGEENPNFVGFEPISGLNESHTFVLAKDAPKKISPQNILRKFNTTQNISENEKQETDIGNIGILVNGVEINSFKSNDKIYYGPLNEIEVINGGRDYDVVRPPIAEIQNPPGIGNTTALATITVEGNLKSILVDPQEFDIEGVVSVVISGGNGKNAIINPVIEKRYREVEFDARFLTDNGGIDPSTDETITFVSNHYFSNGDKIIYDSNGNTEVGIGTFLGSNATTNTLSNGSYYYTQVVNPRTVKLYSTLDDYKSGINTIGFSTAVSGGIHKFRTTEKKVISKITVLNQGEGYSNHKIYVKSSGISTSFNNIFFKSHHFNDGDIVVYENTGTQIPGLTTSNYYFVSKIDDDYFRICDAGTDKYNSNKENFDRKKYVGLTSTGSDYHIFKYPKIEVDVIVSYGSSFTNLSNIVATPVVTGPIKYLNLYENGTSYGSDVVNFEKKPGIAIKTGEYAQVSPYVKDGKIIKVNVLSTGQFYYSTPNLKINGEGTGCILRPVIVNNKLKSVVVINPGIGYVQETTTINVVPAGSGAILNSKVRYLTLDNHYRFGDEFLYKTLNNLEYTLISYTQTLASHLNDDGSKHSPIVGWAYDGNPIYGPYGYSEPYNSNSTVKQLVSGYILNSGNVYNRPEFLDGFFIEDYEFTGSGDLDQYNGRYCKTPEFPNGVYAYFVSSTSDEETSSFKSTYPYFIGPYYRSKKIDDNWSLTQDFDFNNSNLIRNTFPYQINEKNSDYEFYTESNEISKQLTEVKSTAKGRVSSFNIIDPGKDYKVGDACYFEVSDEESGQFTTTISKITGKDISSLEISTEKYENVVLEWSSNYVVGYYEPYVSLLDYDRVTLTGIGTYISSLNGEKICNVKRDQTTLLSDMTSNVTPQEVEDIYVSKIPPTVSVGSTISIGNELLSVLNIFESGSILRVRRSDVGYAHTASDIITVLPNKFTIQSNTNYFNSKINSKIYFNPAQSAGIGTTSGIGIDLQQIVGGVTKDISVPTQSIRIENHPFKTGDSAILRKVATRSPIIVSNTPSSASFSLLYGATLEENVYIINKSKDLIGITTTLDNAFTTNGLFLLGPIPIEYDYSIETDYPQIKCEIQKIVGKIYTTEDHELTSGDLIDLNLTSNDSVGIGTSSSVKISYDPLSKTLLTNTTNFSSSNVNLSENCINIDGHSLKTGNKVFYSYSDSPISGLSSTGYFVYKIDDDNIQLAETYYDTQKQYPNIIKFLSTGGSYQRISLINPEIITERNNTVLFDVSDSSLDGYQLKLFYDSEFNKEFNSVGLSTEINFTGVGTPGVSVTATYTLKYSSNIPEKLYYNLIKDGYPINNDDSVISPSSIRFINNPCNGSFSVSGIGSTEFTFSLPSLPSKLFYSGENCDVLKYSTSSKSAKGGIDNLKILNNQFKYKELPSFVGSNSDSGTDANIIINTDNIGGVNEYLILDQGFDYASDKTLRPEASIPSIIFTSNSSEIKDFSITDGGFGYSSNPSVLLKNPYTNEIVNSDSLSCEVNSGTVSKINIDSPVKGLPTINHELVFINNSNGIGINSIQSSSGGIVTCTLVTPIVSGFINPPFEVGDDIFVENIEKDSVFGDGLNSADYGYSFFKVTSFVNTNPAVLEYNLSGVTTDPGIAKTSQLGYAIIVNKKNYPKVITNQIFSRFKKGEKLFCNSGNGFIEFDLIVEDSKDSYLKVSGPDLYKVKKGNILRGKESGVLSTVVTIVLNESKFEVNYSNTSSLGWSNDIGKLDELFQVVQDNDYYQNLSYSIKSPIEYNEFINPVNNLVHISGLKNFADTQIESKSSFVSYGGTSSQIIVVDVLSESRVDVNKNYSYSVDYDVLNDKSRYLKFNNLTLTDYISCSSNRVLKVDDVSKKFSNKSNDRDLFTNIYTYLEDTLFSKYIIQINDVTNNTYQLSENVVLFYDNNIFSFEKTSLKNSETRLGEITGEVDDYNTKTLRFTPQDPFDTDYDVKYVQTYFDNLDPKKIGINTESIGCINLIGVSTSVGVGTTSTLITFPVTKNNGLVASVFVFDTVRFNFNFVEVIVDSDKSNTYLAEYYFDDTVGLSTNYIATFDSTIQSGILNLKVTNNINTKILVNANIVGFGSTASGIGTYRFRYDGQPEGSERSARFESNYVVSSGISTVFKFKTNEITGSKSLIRVSCGKTSSIHQLLCLQDNYNLYTTQYPFISSNSETGIGTFGAQYSGEYTVVSFYPDNNITGIVTIQSYNQLLYTFNDFENESLATNNTLKYGNVVESVKLAAYDGLNGPRANKVDFDLKYNGTPIFRKVFNPSDSSILDKETGIISIKDHFFNTGERLIYEAKSTFVGVGESSVGIGSTANSVGIVTNILPSEVYAIKIDDDQFRLSTRRDYSLAGIYVTFTSTGEGNAHSLEMYKQFEKSVISIDGVVQKPLSYTPLYFQLANNGGQIGFTTNYFALSGISSISSGDVLKIDDEYVQVISVGFGSTSTGPITESGPYNIVYVNRGHVGTIATTHTDSTEVRVYRGSFNLKSSKIYFTQPPRGSARERRDFSNLPYPTSSFSGRVFLRKNYTNNILYDDISDGFTGLGSSYTLTVQGINTTGIETGSGVLFINGIFQTPSTKNNVGNNYTYEASAGITSVIFSGITSSNGQTIYTDFDVNQNQLPRGGLIVSLGSTPGLGYAPLVGASVTAVLNNITGAVVSVGLGTTDIIGSGYRSPVSIGITDPLHSGTAAVITANVGLGGTLSFNVVTPGSGYVSPSILVSEPSYENLPTTGVFRRGIGNTSETGKNLLVSVEVGGVATTGIGSTYFQVSSFRIARPGYGFQIGDIIKPVGLVTDRRLNSPISEFNITVLDTFSDSFTSWQFGELDYIDSIKNLQDGNRRRFPLYYNGSLLSFQKDEETGVDIDLNSVLVIFVNGVLQEPGDAYQFEGGSSFIFTEPPKSSANISIFFYRGTRNEDSSFVNIFETIKIGDTVRVNGTNYYENSDYQDPRIVEDIVQSDVIQTNLYSGPGIDPDNLRYFDWQKQKEDVLINGDYVYKSRDSIESQVYPTARIIGDFNQNSSAIFVDNVELFDYEENDFSVKINGYDVLIVNGTTPSEAKITTNVSAAGTISSLTIVDSGSGYTQTSPLQIKISAPKYIGVGIGTTAAANVTITNGTITGYTITNEGLGYSQVNPPQVIIPLPEVNYDKITLVRPNTLTQISRGFSGIITGITTATGTSGNPLALKFFVRRKTSALTFFDLNVGYPIYVFNTNVGSGLTSIDSSNSSVVAIGTQYVDNIYYVHNIVKDGPNAVITANIKSNSNVTGISTYGPIENPVGNFSWGMLSNIESRLTNISIGVTGLIVDSGLSTFPSIQRRGYGLRENGSLRKQFSI